MGEEQQVDYAAIKARLKNLQPKTRLSTRDAQLAQLRDELLEAHNRGVSFNTLSAELKSSGITVSASALSKFLGRSAAKPKPKRHHQTKSSVKKPPEHGQSDATPN